MFRYDLPNAASGQTVGIFGGSFDPAHEGHVHVATTALQRFGLDQVWWVVSPGNPLKSDGPAPLNERIDYARRIMDHPNVTVTDIEAKLGTVFTKDTLSRLIDLYPGVRFVWIMGAILDPKNHRPQGQCSR